MSGPTARALRRRGQALLGALALLGCRAAPAAPLLRVVATPGRLALVPAPHIRINARLAPALELRDGSVIRFEGRRTADSTYFAEPPAAPLPAGAVPRGHLRASVCRDDEAVCRSLAVEL